MMRQVVSKRWQKITNEVGDFLSLLSRIQIKSFRNAKMLLKKTKIYLKKRTIKNRWPCCGGPLSAEKNKDKQTKIYLKKCIKKKKLNKLKMKDLEKKKCK